MADDRTVSQHATAPKGARLLREESPAFRKALLTSEVRRAYVLLAVLVTVAAMVVVQESANKLDRRIPMLAFFALGALVALQGGVLAFVHVAKRRGHGMPLWFATTTVVIESLVPTGLIFGHLLLGTFSPYAALTGPPVQAYGLMICLTTLRLRPMLCIVAGIVSAGSYFALLEYVKFDMHVPDPTYQLPRPAYVSVAFLLLISGVAAAWVAREIRAMFEVTLREAETQRKIDRIEQELSVARTIQQALLPSAAPTVQGYEIAGWNRAAEETGGDYYDWQELPDGKWIVSLADVSGHGLGPSLVTAACRAYVRASGQYDGDLESLTARVNRLLAADLPEGRFVTMVSVLLDPRGGPIGVLSAGHGPLLLWVHSNSTVEDIEPQNVPLAIVADMTFGPTHTLTLEKGDVLALITDGFWEWARLKQDGKRELYGLERLRDSLKRHAHRPPSELMEALASDVQAFAEGEAQQDDLTVVVVKKV